jgi:ArsR family transcriptional regulator
MVINYMRISAYKVEGGEMRDLVKAFKSLSDETRLRMLNILLERECCVCEVMQVLDISQTRASRNLGMLYDAGFLKMRKDGLWSHYSIDYESVKTYCPDLVDVVKMALIDNEEAEFDRERLKEAVPLGLICEPECCD